MTNKKEVRKPAYTANLRTSVFNPNSGIRTHGLYPANNSTKLKEITSDKNGSATAKLDPGNYVLRELRVPTGFMPESDAIPFSIATDQEIKVSITNTSVGNIAREPTEKPAPERPVTGPSGAKEIIIPRTGELFPTGQYILSQLCFGIATVCGILLCRRKRHQ